MRDLHLEVRALDVGPRRDVAEFDVAAFAGFQTLLNYFWSLVAGARPVKSCMV